MPPAHLVLEREVRKEVTFQGHPRTASEDPSTGCSLLLCLTYNHPPSSLFITDFINIIYFLEVLG